MLSRQGDSSPDVSRSKSGGAHRGVYSFAPSLHLGPPKLCWLHVHDKALDNMHEVMFPATPVRNW